jgi:S1-C subfamily serine protease
LKGEVVGMNTAPAGRRDWLMTVNHVLPAARVRRIADDLAEFGQVRRPYLGVEVEPVEVLPRGQVGPGALVISRVGPGTPAAAAGLRPGDKIMSAGGQPLLGLGQLQALVEASPIGEELTLVVERGGQRIEIKVRPQAQPVPAGPQGGVRSRIEPEREPDAARGRIRSRPRATPPAPTEPQVKPPDPGETPSLEPIPRPERMEEP